METIKGCSFDKELKNLAVITPDNKLRVYDIDLKRLKVECSEKDNLSTRFNCLSWLSSTEIAVGCGNGDIIVYSTQTAEATHRLKSTGSVTSLWWCPTQNQLISHAAGGVISVWDVKSEKITNQIRGPKDVRSVAVTSDDSLLITGSFNIKVISTQTGALVNKFQGRHSAPIVRLIPARQQNNNKDDAKRKVSKAVLSCSATERQMYLWISDMKSTGKSTGNLEPLQCFVADATIVAADVIVINDDEEDDDTKKTYGILAVTTSGNVNLWKWQQSQRPKKTTAAYHSKPEKPHVRIVSDNAQGVPIFNAAFCDDDTNGTTIITARGASTLMPRFDKTVVSYEKTLPTQKNPVYTLPATSTDLLTYENDGQQQKKKRAKTDESGNVNVLAPHESGALTLASGGDSDKGNGKKVEMTLAERVASEDAISNSIRANSMHSVLMQAIRTNDQTLLDTVLYSRTASEQSMTILSNTIRNLPPQYVVPLLNLLVDKFRYSPAHGLILVQWVKVILTEHLSYLMTIPNIVSTLSGLYLMINSRIETHKTLLKLSGRLDLVLAQVAKAQIGSDAAPPMNIIVEDGEDGDPKFLSLEDVEDDEGEEDDDEEMEQITGESAYLDDDEEEEEEDEDEDEDGLNDDEEEEDDDDGMDEE